MPRPRLRLKTRAVRGHFYVSDRLIREALFSVPHPIFVPRRGPGFRRRGRHRDGDLRSRWRSAPAPLAIGRSERGWWAPSRTDGLGKRVIRRAIFAMVLDCRANGAGDEVVRAVLRGETTHRAGLGRADQLDLAERGQD